MEAEPIIPLEMLKANDTAIVEELYGPPGWVGRMAELGLGVGVTVRMLSAGSPYLVALGGVRLSLRHDAGELILVRPVQNEIPVALALEPVAGRA